MRSWGLWLLLVGAILESISLILMIISASLSLAATPGSWLSVETYYALSGISGFGIPVFFLGLAPYAFRFAKSPRRYRRPFLVVYPVAILAMFVYAIGLVILYDSFLSDPFNQSTQNLSIMMSIAGPLGTLLLMIAGVLAVLGLRQKR
jgi:hypothetical protein